MKLKKKSLFLHILIDKIIFFSAYFYDLFLVLVHIYEKLMSWFIKRDLYCKKRLTQYYDIY